MEKCNYVGCKNDATTKGFVLSRDSQGRKHLPTDVYACDKHKKSSSFFEYKTAKTKYNPYFDERSKDEIHY
ncbi:hypothetical protein P5G86_31275 [Paenibacillus jamilae]|uniref:Uncharacterized protein n=1 Tax=Bacillus thuringiensis serovar subtoxicus TaxID=475791 RepID=A0A9X6FJE3_BACTU|nr:hypothetical protein [Bacillus thuringiensis]MEB4844415.1 hypothetical protein [Paenibacillus jamilae]MEB8584397.1 hypothetical protein [Bacillus cereus]MCR6856713.1 hypothetical protein [Bacillus thuringiensis]MDR4282404.1 hypothetical protein [Bacillus thuringiensis]MEB8596027.1 hypothetical protein [Bacillus cereus]